LGKLIFLGQGYNLLHNVLARLPCLIEARQQFLAFLRVDQRPRLFQVLVDLPLE